MKTKWAIAAISASFIAGSIATNLVMKQKLERANATSKAMNEIVLNHLNQNTELQTLTEMDAFLDALDFVISLDKQNPSRTEIKSDYINAINRKSSKLTREREGFKSESSINQASLLIERSIRLKKDIDFRY